MCQSAYPVLRACRKADNDHYAGALSTVLGNHFQPNTGSFQTMMQAFRKFFSSKIGLGVTLAFLVLIALAFASSDVAGSNTFGGVAGGNRVAVVGDRKIGSGEMDTIARNRVNAMRREDPTLTMESFINDGQFESLLEAQLDRFAIAEFANKYGFEAGKRLVDSEIANIDAFRGADGSFDATIYANTLRSQRLTDSQVRGDIRDTLLLRQVVNPIGFGAQMPRSMADRYAAIFSETRTGSILSVPSSSFAPREGPNAATLNKYYGDNRRAWVRPERRTVRYATFGGDALGDLQAPSNAQIAERYRRDRDQYAASQQRSLTQLVVPTRAAADAILSEVRSGTALAQAASGKGLATTSVGPIAKDDLAEQTSEAVAEAAFAANSGSIAAVARGPLGYYLVRVDSVEDIGGRTIAQVRGDIRTALLAEQRQEALIGLASSVEEELDNGSSLSEIARELGVELATTRPITLQGQVYGTNDTAPEVLAPAITTVFDMDASEPQIAEVVAGETFLVFEVADVIESSAPPLAEVRDAVIAAWKLDRGSVKAKEVADAIVKRMDGGASLAAAIRAERASLPAPEPVSLSREQLSELAQSQRIGPEFALLFSMAEGSAKKLEQPSDQGWLVVALADIAPEDNLSDEQKATFRTQIATVLGDEYAAQFRTAAREDVGVERNDDAIAALRGQLLGNTAAN